MEPENGHDESEIEQIMGAEGLTGTYPGDNFPAGSEFPGKQKILKAPKTIDLSIKRMELVTAPFEVQGITSLITVPMSKKAMEGIKAAVKRKKQKKTAAGPIAPEEPEEEDATDEEALLGSIYVVDPGPPRVLGGVRQGTASEVAWSLAKPGFVSFGEFGAEGLCNALSG